MAQTSICRQYAAKKQKYIAANRRFISYLHFDPVTGRGGWQFIMFDHPFEEPSQRLLKAFTREVGRLAYAGTLSDYTRYAPGYASTERVI